MQFRNAFSSFAVDDLDVATKFYSEVLGITVQKMEIGVIQLEFEGTKVMVYPKEDHVPGTFTVLNFEVDEIDRAVDELTSRGVTFERYEQFKMDDKNIARDAGGPAVAWFKDPSGNIMSVVTT